MTPAIKAAEAAGIKYQIHEYSHDPAASSYGEEAAELLGVPPQQVFKTLVLSSNDNQLLVAMIPVSHKLELKSVAKTLGVKKVSVANPNVAENTTGYILGGISPLGQKKRLIFILDSSAELFERIYISGGKRGLELELTTNDLIRLCNAKYADIKAS